MKEALGTKNQWNPEYYDQTASFVAKYGEDVLPLLRAKEGECILDLGCGTGSHAHQIALLGASVIGIDASQNMIRKAKESYPHLEFRIGSGEDFQLERKVDAVFSNAALHWMKRPERVISSVNHCLKSGGRFVGEMGCRGNVDSIIQALYQALEEHGIEKKIYTIHGISRVLANIRLFLNREDLKYVTFPLSFDQQNLLKKMKASRDGLLTLRGIFLHI